MNKKRLHQLLIGLAVILLTLPIPITRLQAASVLTQSVGRLTVAPGVTMEILEPQLLKWEGKTQLSFRLNVTNNSASTVDLLRYGIGLSINGRSAFDAARLKGEEDGTRIAAKTNREFRFRSTVPAGTAFSDIRVTFKEWGLHYAGYFKSIGSLKLPATYQPAVPVGQDKIVIVEGSRLGISVQGLYENQSSDGRVYALSIQAENKGGRTMELPEYQYWLRTAKGDLYEMNAQESEAAKVSPKDRLAIDLYTSLPAKERGEPVELLIGTLEEDIPWVVCTLKLPASLKWTQLAPDTQKIHKLQSNNHDFTLVAGPLSISETTKTETKAGLILTLSNPGKYRIPVPDVRYFLEAEGLTYELESQQSDAGENIGALKQMKLTLNATLPQSVLKKKLHLLVIEQLDEEQDEAFYPLSRFPLVKAQEQKKSLDYRSSQTVEREGSSVTVSLEQLSNATEGAYHQVTGLFVFRNNGPLAADIPAYRFNAVLAGGRYEAAFEGTSEKPVARGETIRQPFTVSIPRQLELKDLHLVLEEPFSESETGLFTQTADFWIPGIMNSDLAAEKWIDLDVDSEKFQARLVRTTRLPMENEDILVSEIELISGDAKRRSVPQLQGTFVIDGLKAEAKTIVLDKVSSVTQATPLHVYMITPLSYSVSPEKVSLLLARKTDAEARTIGRFSLGTFEPITSYALQDVYRLGAVGSEMEVRLQDVTVYPGLSDDLIEIQMLQTNVNKRSQKLGALVGFLRDDRDVYYPLEFQSNAKQPRYGSLAIQSFSGRIPKGVKVDQLKLLLGTGVTESGLLEQEGAAAGYVQAGLYDLMEESANPAVALTNMNASPYAVHLNNLLAEQKSGYSGSLAFNARAVPMLAFDYFDDEHKLIVRIENNGLLLTEKEYALGGRSDTGTISVTDTKYRIDGLTTELTTPSLDISVYLQYKEERKLLGKQTIAANFVKGKETESGSSSGEESYKNSEAYWEWLRKKEIGEHE